MINRLPRWVWLGACVLAFIAGMVNVVGLLSVDRQAVSHVTGTTSLLGAALAAGDRDALGRLGAILAAFFAGSVLSGMLIRDSTLRLGRRYGVVLSIEAALLAAAVPLLELQRGSGLYVLAAACGLQNAMASAYSGAVVRTSHITGMVTDLGIFVGHWMRGTRIEWRRVQLCLIVVAAFFGGGVSGAWMFAGIGFATLYVPAALTATTALAYAVYRWRTLGGGARDGGR